MRDLCTIVPGTPAPQGSQFGYPEGQRVAYAACEAPVGSRPAAAPQGSLICYPEGQRVAYAACEAPVGSRPAAAPQGSQFGYPEGQRVAYAACEARDLWGCSFCGIYNASVMRAAGCRRRRRRSAGYLR